MKKDLYRLLGVARDASEAEIKSAYRSLAKEYHPDRNKDDPVVADRFKEISNAYRILGDKDLRAKYDRGDIDHMGQETGFSGFSGGGGRSGGFGGDAGGFGANPEDIFAEFFSGFGRRAGAGQQRSQPKPQRGDDVQTEASVDFIDAIKGTKAKVKLPTGKTLAVTIPAGVRNGQQIRLSGQGKPGKAGGKAGDAMVSVKIREHPWFSREGDHILLDLPISIDEAVLGAKVVVPTIDGSISLTIPKNSSGGRRLRLKGKGVEGKGDFLAILRIVLPGEPDEKLEKAIRGWAKNGENANVRAHFDREKAEE